MTTHPVRGVRGPDELLIGLAHLASCDGDRSTGFGLGDIDRDTMIDLL
jgi:hypothetical protein